MAWYQWLHWLIALFGVLLILAPFVFNYATSTYALWTSIVLGVLVALLSIVTFFAGRRVPATR